MAKELGVKDQHSNFQLIKIRTIKMISFEFYNIGNRFEEVINNGFQIESQNISLE